MTEDRTSLSYWFPKLVAAGLPVPATDIFTMPSAAQAAVWKAFDGEKGSSDEDAALQEFAATIAGAAARFGSPAFLRTGHTSGKHDWQNACFLGTGADVLRHIFTIAEYSEINGMFGELPWNEWVVREFLPTIPFGVCPAFGEMPICREFRFFVDDATIRCWHPYWPLHALEQGGAPSFIDFAELCRLPDVTLVSDLASRAGAACGGAWSVDILETRRGWFITDMAEAHKSFHWEGCKRGPGAA